MENMSHKPSINIIENTEKKALRQKCKIENHQLIDAIYIKPQHWDIEDILR